MDTEIFTAFNRLHEKLDAHRSYIEKRVDDTDKKVTEICTFIKTKKEITNEKSQNSNKKFYIAIAVIGISFGMIEVIQGLF